eukprot:COSAG05_NODE_4783_length_1374_cov_26.435294_2_plen_162_part_00
MSQQWTWARWIRGQALLLDQMHLWMHARRARANVDRWPKQNMARKMVGQSTARPNAASAWRHIVFPAPDGVLPATGYARGRVWTWARAVSRSSSLTRLSPRSQAPSLGVQARRSSKGQFPAGLRRIQHPGLVRAAATHTHTRTHTHARTHTHEHTHPHTTR